MNDIEKFCEKYLENYKINNDGTIDVDGDVDLYCRIVNMEKLPVKFGKVSGEFDCRWNNLITLEGCPEYVGGDFLCEKNNIYTLEYFPKYIGGSFSCNPNKSLTTLKGIEKCEILGSFHCENNNIPPENYIYIITAKIGGYIYTDIPQIDKILNTYKNEVKYLHKALSELKKVVL
jgi:hypothetical protein